MSAAVSTVAPSDRIKQKRSRKTYDALINTAFAMLEDREFDDISIAELSRRAGYSVGAFYARFKSKDELFDAMVQRHIEGRRATRARLFATAPDDELIRELLQETVDYYWNRRRFWRAALIRSIRDTEFWEPLRKLGQEIADAIMERVRARTGRRPSQTEETNIRFAVQLALGTINNTIINRPGPIFMGQKLFIDNLTRAFRLVSGYDELMARGRNGARPAASRARRGGAKPRR